MNIKHEKYFPYRRYRDGLVAAFVHIRPRIFSRHVVHVCLSYADGISACGCSETAEITRGSTARRETVPEREGEMRRCNSIFYRLNGKSGGS